MIPLIRAHHLLRITYDVIIELKNGDIKVRLRVMVRQHPNMEIWIDPLKTLIPKSHSRTDVMPCVWIQS